jgi:predicted RNA binding protein YcfA (HicA-like mRNA interferase family)
MAVLPLLRPRDVIRAFEKTGWRVTRQRGSHIILTRPGASVTLLIPDHDLVARGTLRTLIAAAGITVEQFLLDAERR